MAVNGLKIIKFSSLSIVIGFLFTLVINTSLFDEALDPELERLLVPQHNIPIDNNLFVYWYALNAKSGSDPAEKSAAMFQQLANMSQAEMAQESDKMSFIEEEDNEDSIWLDSYAELNCNSRYQAGCLKLISDVIKAKPVENQRLLELLNRFRLSKSFGIYNEPIFHHYAELMPKFRLALQLNKLDLATSYLNDDPVYFLKSVNENLNMWSLVFIHGKSLISKMVAINGMRQCLLFLSEFIAGQPSEVIGSEEIATMIRLITTPLEKESLNIDESFIAEQVWWSSSLDTRLPNEENRMLTWFYQKNATQNLFYHSFTLPMIMLSGLSSGEFKTALERNIIESTQKKAIPNKDFFSVSPSAFYNFYGKYLVSISISSAQDYIGRVHDLDGLYRVLQAQFLLKINTQQSVSTLLKGSDLRQPYQDAPMIYNDKNTTLGFECFNPSDLCKVTL